MATHSGAYRALTFLYPRSFRQEYGDDLVRFFEELLTDRGAAHAWARTTADLAISIPRLRLEHAMTANRREAALITLTTVLLASAGIMLLMLGLGPVLPLALLAAAVAATLAMRRSLAGTPAPPRARRRRLTTAAVLAAVFVAALGSYLVDIGDYRISEVSLLAHGLIGMLSLAGATVTIVAALARPGRREAAATPR